MREDVKYGRKTFSLDNGKAVLTRISITEKSFPREDENAFTERLIRKYGSLQGTIEVVFKDGHPDYAIVTLI